MNGKTNVLGESKLTGNATLAAVLSGYTFYSDDPKVKKVGNMPNHGAWNTTINPGKSVAIPAGYHNGGGSVTATSQGILAGYKLVTGSLVGIPANWTTDAAARGFSIPAGCIPLILQMEGCTVFTGKGETAKLIIKVYDNSGSNIFYVERTNSGYLGTGQIAISPMALYGNNIEALKGITAIYQKIYNQEEGLLSEYNCGALTVTTWLQKV